MKFTSDTVGLITGLRFYKGPSNTGAHVGHLWDSAGDLLATATFTGETDSGWQQVNFASPVAISANTTYVASYYAPQGHYAADSGYFATAGVDTPPLHALSNTAAGGNGVFVYGAGGGFPTSTFNATNYWVDVVFNNVATTTNLTSDVNPSSFGQKVTFSATVSGSVTPTGTVSVYDGAALLGTANYSGGTVSVSTSSLTVGTHAITAKFAGDPGFDSSQGGLTQTVAYATTVLGDYSKPQMSGGTLPVKLEVTDYNGVNLSSPGLAVTAMGIAPAGASAPTMPAQDAGHANPGGPFRYDSTLQGYIFSLKLVDASGAGLAAGNYTLFYTIGVDPTQHMFNFSVRMT